MKELVEVIAKSLVDHPEDVRVEEKQQDRQVTLELRVDEDDMGKVIGRQGRSSVGTVFFGNVTEKVVRKSLCPVLVIPKSFEIRE